MPMVKSNCVRCHLTAGRELTAPAQDFARSVHDLHGMTCSDCHGGNRDKDSSAHEEEFGFIGTKLSAAHGRLCRVPRRTGGGGEIGSALLGLLQER